MIARDGASPGPDAHVRALELLGGVPASDGSGFHRLLEGLPDQAREAWTLGRDTALPADFRRPSRVVLLGVGGSAIGADVTANLARQRSRVPVDVVRNYVPPGLDPDALVVACSFSGGTEETLAAFDIALGTPGMRLALTTGGPLAERAAEAGATVVRYSWDGPPRTGFGYGLFTLIGLLERLGVFDLGDEVETAIEAVREATDRYAVDSADNPARRLADALGDAVPFIVGADYLDVAARRFASEVNENAKRWAFTGSLPEFDHNGLQGLAGPGGSPANVTTLLLDSPAIHPRNRARVHHTAAVLREQGAAVRVIETGGTAPLEAILR
ncbi:MAG: SIS domain-containing protein, partial [Dehalococcoidia bacterium]